VLLPLGNEWTLFGYLTGPIPDAPNMDSGMNCSLEYADAHGRQWSFLRGNEPYKFDWGARRIPKRGLGIER
jgi:hypothetical protein